MRWLEQIYIHHVENLPRGHLQHPSVSAINEGHLLAASVFQMPEENAEHFKLG